MFSWVNDNLVAVAALLTAIIPIIQYVLHKNSENKNRNFEVYHRLIRELVDADETPKVDRQVAIIYELRNFKNYYPVTIRILEGLKESWDKTGHKRIMQEIDLALTYIKPKIACNYCCKK